VGTLRRRTGADTEGVVAGPRRARTRLGAAGLRALRLGRHHRTGLTRLSLTRLGLARLGLTRLSLARLGLTRLGLA